MRRAATACALAVLLGACGSSDRPALPASCSAATERLVAALSRAPQPVTLSDGTRLSHCVRDADSTADLQNLGVGLQQAADRLRAAAADGDAQAAVALGYLVGATRKGAAQTPGVAAELAVRVGRVAGRLLDADPTLRSAVARGLRAGERLG